MISPMKSLLSNVHLALGFPLPLLKVGSIHACRAVLLAGVDFAGSKVSTNFC